MIGLTSLFFLFWFLGYLRSCLQRAEGEGGWVTSVAFGGGLLAAGMLLVSGGFTLAGSVLSDYGRDPQVARTLAVLNWDWIAVVSVPLAALVGGTAVVGLRFRALPRWLGWISAVLTLALLVPPIMYLGFVAIFLWIVIVSVVLLIRAGRVAQAQPAN